MSGFLLLYHSPTATNFTLPAAPAPCFSPHWWPSWFLLSRDLKSGRIMRHLMAGVLLQDFASHESSWVIMDWAWFKVFAIFCNLACLHRTSTMQQQPTLGSEKGGKHPGRHQKGSCPTVKPASPIQWRDEILRSPLQDFYCLVQTSSQFSRHVEANLFFGVCDAWMALQRRTWGDVRLPMCNPWCWNIYQHLPHKSPSFVGKYTSTMGCIWVLTTNVAIRRWNPQLVTGDEIPTSAGKKSPMVWGLKARCVTGENLWDISMIRWLINVNNIMLILNMNPQICFFLLGLEFWLAIDEPWSKDGEVW